MVDKCDKIMVGAFCAMIFFLPISSAAVEGLFGVVFLSFIVKRALFFKHLLSSAKGVNPVVLLGKAFRPIPNLVNKPIVAFLAAVLVSMIFSQYKAAVLKGFFFDLLQGVFLFFIFVEAFNSQRRLKMFLWSILASLSLIGIDGIFQYFTHIDFLRQRPVTDGRITASFRHANDLGAYLVALCPMVFCLSGFWRKIKFYKKNPMNMLVKKHFFLTKNFKMLMMLLFVGIIFCIGVTYSRSTWLALGLSMFVLLLKKPKMLGIFIVITGIFLSVFIFKMHHERQGPVYHRDTKELMSMANMDEGLFHSTGRLEYWGQAWRIIKERPLFGVGLNAYTKASANDTELDFDGYPHNCFLQIMAETGFFGLLAFLWILTRVVKTSYHLSIHIQDEFHHALFVGLVCGFLGFLVQAFFDTTFNSVQLGAFLWLLMAFIVAIPKVVLKGEEGDKISSYSFH